MTVLSLVPPLPPQQTTWRVVLKSGKSFIIKAHTAFESDTRVYFTDLIGQEMNQALNSGRIVSNVVAAFDQERVLYFAKENIVLDPSSASKATRKKS